MAKTRFQGLICKRFELSGVRSEENSGQNEIKNKLQGLACKTGVPGAQVNFIETKG